LITLINELCKTTEKVLIFISALFKFQIMSLELRK